MDIPDDFVPLFRSSPFTEMVGPLYCRGKGSELSIGLLVVEKHCNSNGIVHGGMPATLCDIALGYATSFASDPPIPMITAHLNLDLAGTAKLGDWIESSTTVQRKGSRLAFANAYLRVGEERIVHASGCFWC